MATASGPVWLAVAVAPTVIDALLPWAGLPQLSLLGRHAAGLAGRVCCRRLFLAVGVADVAISLRSNRAMRAEWAAYGFRVWRVQMDNRAPSMLKSTLIGGALFSGFVSGLPVVGALNCACCALVVGGGFLAAYLYSKECSGAGVAFKPGNGALIGLVAGLFYAIVASIVSGIVRLIMPTDPDQIIDMLEQAGVPSESIDIAAKWIESSTGIMGLIFGFFIALLLAAIFSTIGGLIGGAAFKVEPPPPVPPAQQPTPPPPSDAPAP